jgi:hypothetical protein
MIADVFSGTAEKRQAVPSRSILKACEPSIMEQMDLFDFQNCPSPFFKRNLHDSSEARSKKSAVEILILMASFQDMKEFAKKPQARNITRQPDTHHET